MIENNKVMKKANITIVKWITKSSVIYIVKDAAGENPSSTNEKIWYIHDWESSDYKKEVLWVWTYKNENSQVIYTDRNYPVFYTVRNPIAVGLRLDSKFGDENLSPTGRGL